ncbi:hypothetical protein NC652_015664 [Populus alba x Populus x berolinensis]|nr:hypothetical protein NC652_015664 [Populus alba x Populus x berolinensis]
MKQIPCAGSIINKEKVAAQEPELGVMDMLAKRSSVVKALRQSLQDTAMDWTGAAAARNCGYVLLGILVMVGMETAPEELGFWVAIKTDGDRCVRVDGTPLDRGRQAFGGHGHGLDSVQPPPET